MTALAFRRKSDRERSPSRSPIGRRDGRHHRRSPRLRHRSLDSRQFSRSPRRRHRSPRRRESPDQKRHTRHGERRHESRDLHRPRHLSDDEQQPSPKRRRVAAHADDGREAQPMEQGSILRGTIQSVKGFGEILKALLLTCSTANAVVLSEPRTL